MGHPSSGQVELTVLRGPGVFGRVSVGFEVGFVFVCLFVGLFVFLFSLPQSKTTKSSRPQT